MIGRSCAQLTLSPAVCAVDPKSTDRMYCPLKRARWRCCERQGANSETVAATDLCRSAPATPAVPRRLKPYDPFSERCIENSRDPSSSSCSIDSRFFPTVNNCQIALPVFGFVSSRGRTRRLQTYVVFHLAEFRPGPLHLSNKTSTSKKHARSNFSKSSTNRRRGVECG